MFLDYKDEDYRKEADRINERAAKDFAYAKPGKISADQLRYAKEQSRQFFIEQGGNPDRGSQVHDVKVIIDPPEGNNFFRIETGIGGPYAAGGFKLVAVLQHERLAERKRDMMEDGQRPWMRVDVGEGLRRHHKIQKSTGDFNLTSTWSKADWEMERSRLFDEAKATAKAAETEKPIARMAPPPPAFMMRETQRPAVQR